MTDILKVCKYCGNEYAGWALGCCGKSIAHAVYVIDDDEEGTQYDTYDEAASTIKSRKVEP